LGRAADGGRSGTAGRGAKDNRNEQINSL